MKPSVIAVPVELAVKFLGRDFSAAVQDILNVEPDAATDNPSDFLYEGLLDLRQRSQQVVEQGLVTC